MCVSIHLFIYQCISLSLYVSALTRVTPELTLVSYGGTAHILQGNVFKTASWIPDWHVW